MEHGFPTDDLFQVTMQPNITILNLEAAKGFIYWSEAVIQPVILAFGFFTNIVSLLVMQKVKLASTFRTCLIALCISDLCATLTGFAQIVVEVAYFDGSIPFGHWRSEAVASFALYFIFLMFMCTSGSIVILVAVIRNLIVLKPLRARCYFTRRRTKWICFGVFLGTFCIYAPVSLNVIWQSCYKDDVTDICISVNETVTLARLEYVVNKYLFAISMLYGPIMLLTYIACVVCIWVTLKRSSKSLDHMTLKRSNSQLDSTKKRIKATGRITFTLLMILIIDIVCTLPTVAYGIGLVVKPKKTVFDDSEVIFEVFDVIAEIVFACRPCYNFYLYMCQHEEFRKRFLDLTRGAFKTCARIPLCCRKFMSPCVQRKSFEIQNGDHCKDSGDVMGPSDSGIVLGTVPTNLELISVGEQSTSPRIYIGNSIFANSESLHTVHRC